MSITSNDIDNKSFSVDRKGYSIEEVDIFLEHVSSEVDALNNKIKELETAPKKDNPDMVTIPKKQKAEMDKKLKDAQDKIEELKDELSKKTDDGHAISEALIVAQRSANNIVDSAKKKADKIVHDANIKSDEIIKDINIEKANVEKEIDKLKNERKDCKNGYEKMLKDIIDTMNLHLEDLSNDMYRNASIEKTGAIKKPVNHANANVAAKPAATGSVAPNAPAPQNPTATSASAPAKAEPQKDFSGFGDADFGEANID